MNERLSERRQGLEKKLLTAKVHIIITLILTLMNTLVGLFTSYVFMFASYGFFIPQYAAMAGRAFGISEDAVRPGTIILALLVFFGVLGFYLAAALKIREKRVYVSFAFYLYIADIASLALAAPGLNFQTVTVAVFVLNAVLHIYGLFILMRAVKAAKGLETLPEKETEEDEDDIFASLRAEQEQNGGEKEGENRQ